MSLLAASLAVVVASPRPASATTTGCDPVDVVVNTGGTAAGPAERLLTYRPDGTLRRDVPLAVPAGAPADADYGDLAFSSDGTVLYAVDLSGARRTLVALDPLSGDVVPGSQRTLTGAVVGYSSLNGLTSRPDGKLYLGSKNSPTVFLVDPADGSTTASSLVFPSGSVSGGDFVTLDGGDVLALSEADPAQAGSYLLRFHHDGRPPTRVGDLPKVWGMALSAGKLHFAGASGDLLEVAAIPPDVVNLGPLATTTRATAAGQKFFGATSVQDSGSCNVLTTTSDAATYAAGQQPQLQVSGLASSARGTVAFTHAGVVLCTVVLPATSCQAPPLPPGTHTAVATLSSNGQTSTTTFTVLAPVPPPPPPPGTSPALLPQAVVVGAPASAPLAGGPVQVVALASGGGALTYSSSDPAVATVDGSGLVSLHSAGQVTITVTAAATSTHTAGTGTATIDVLAPAVPAPPAPAPPGAPVPPAGGVPPGDALPPGASRLGGPDRVGTSVAVSNALFPAPAAQAATDVIIATAATFADAIGGARLAAQLRAPLLLTDPAVLDARVAAEVVRLARSSGTVYVLGQRDAVSAAVEADLRDRSPGYAVVRVGGADRYETAVRIADQVRARAGDQAPVYLVTGRDPDDGLVVSPLAYRTGGVVLLTDGGSMPAVTARYLDTHDATGARTVVVGGQASAAQVAAGRSVGLSVVGGDRYETAALLARRFAQLTDAAGAVTPVAVVGVAGGGSWPDSLAGAAAMSHLGGPLLLTAAGAGTLPRPTREVLSDLGTGADRAVVFGGAGPVTDAVLDQVKALIRR